MSGQVRSAQVMSRSGQVTSGKNQVSSKLVKWQARAGMVRYGQVKVLSDQMTASPDFVEVNT